MSNEEKQLENTQSPTAESSQPSTGVASNTPASGENMDAQQTANGQAYTATAKDAATDDAVERATTASETVSENTTSADSAVSAAAAMEALVAANELMKAQLEDFKNQYARLGADFENFRKRTQKEKEELDLQVKCATIKEMLPVVDNFERARSQIKPQNDGEMNIHKSYQSVYKQLVDCLKRIGVSPMRPEGQPFDPNLHEAVLRESTDEYPEGTVTEELMRGYVLGDRILRHAMVKVAAAPEGVVTSEEAEPEISES